MSKIKSQPKAAIKGAKPAPKKAPKKTAPKKVTPKKAPVKPKAIKAAPRAGDPIGSP